MNKINTYFLLAIVLSQSLSAYAMMTPTGPKVPKLEFFGNRGEPIVFSIGGSSWLERPILDTLPSRSTLIAGTSMVAGTSLALYGIYRYRSQIAAGLMATPRYGLDAISTAFGKIKEHPKLLAGAATGAAVTAVCAYAPTELRNKILGGAALFGALGCGLYSNREALSCAVDTAGKTIVNDLKANKSRLAVLGLTGTAGYFLAPSNNRISDELKQPKVLGAVLATGATTYALKRLYDSYSNSRTYNNCSSFSKDLHNATKEDAEQSITARMKRHFGATAFDVVRYPVLLSAQKAELKIRAEKEKRIIQECIEQLCSTDPDIVKEFKRLYEINDARDCQASVMLNHICDSIAGNDGRNLAGLTGSWDIFSHRFDVVHKPLYTAAARERVALAISLIKDYTRLEIIKNHYEQDLRS